MKQEEQDGELYKAPKLLEPIIYKLNPLRTELILILHFLHISNHTLISNASLHHWLQRWAINYIRK